MITVPLVLAAALGTGAGFQLPASVARALDEGAFEATPAGFRAIALSHIADGCADRNDDDAGRASQCVRAAWQRVRALLPKDARRGGPVHGLVETHAALVLGAADRIGPCLDEELHRSLATRLERASLVDDHGHAPSFVDDAHRWPADQAATLAALARFDRAHAAATVVEPRARYFTVLETRGLDDETGLPFSELERGGTGPLPRGCALSYSLRYLAEVDVDRARSWWERYRAHYLVDAVVLVGFREWPRGRERKADIDSGPIVHDVGAAATAFGIAAARAFDDDVLARRLEATAATVATYAKRDPSLRRPAGSTLASAILFQAERQRSLIDGPT